MNLSSYTSKFRASLIIDSYQGWASKNDKVLDVGCGTGVVAKQLAKHFKLKIVGCDIQYYLTKKIKFKKMTFPGKLPFKDKSFDIIMFNDVLHHTSYANQQKLLVEALRVGEKVLIFEVKPTLAGRIADYLINKVHYKNLQIPFNFRRAENWEKLFRKMKLNYKTKIIKRGFYYPFSHIAFRLEKRTGGN